MSEKNFDVESIIYSFVNLINNKAYIGKTTQKLNQRIGEHKRDALGRLKNTLFYNALRKYGMESFEVRLLYKEKCDSVKLNDLEKKYIALFETNNKSKGYNLTDGGDGNRRVYFNIDEAITMHRNGATVRLISKKMKTKECNVYKYLNSKGITFLGKYRGLNALLIDIYTNEIYKFKTIKDVSKYLIDNNYSNGSIENICGHISKNSNAGQVLFGQFLIHTYDLKGVDNLVYKN